MGAAILNLREYKPDAQRVADGKERLSLILTMAEYFRISCDDIRARIAEWPHPAEYDGERPDMTARQLGWRPGIVLDCVTEAELAEPMRFRLQTLERYAKALNSEFHLACLAERAERVRARVSMARVVAHVWSL